MKVGTICKLKMDCLGNKAGTLGVVFYNYGDGFQAIFENGNLDGFSTQREITPLQHAEIEADYFLEEVGFDESLAGYQFKNVVQVARDYKAGVFDIGWRENLKKMREGCLVSAPPTPEYEKCKVYADGNKPPWLRFERYREGVPTENLLSAAMDYVDFSHFEYEGPRKGVEPRWFHGDITICPKYVVFRKKL